MRVEVCWSKCFITTEKDIQAVCRTLNWLHSAISEEGVNAWNQSFITKQWFVSFALFSCCDWSNHTEKRFRFPMSLSDVLLTIDCLKSQSPENMRGLSEAQFIFHKHSHRTVTFHWVTTQHKQWDLLLSLSWLTVRTSPRRPSTVEDSLASPS